MSGDPFEVRRRVVVHIGELTDGAFVVCVDGVAGPGQWDWCPELRELLQVVRRGIRSELRK